MFNVFCNFGYRRTYFRSEKKKKNRFLFAILSLNRNFAPKIQKQR